MTVLLSVLLIPPAKRFYTQLISVLFTPTIVSASLLFEQMELRVRLEMDKIIEDTKLKLNQVWHAKIGIKTTHLKFHLQREQQLMTLMATTITVGIPLLTYNLGFGVTDLTLEQLNNATQLPIQDLLTPEPHILHANISLKDQTELRWYQLLSLTQFSSVMHFATYILNVKSLAFNNQMEDVILWNLVLLMMLPSASTTFILLLVFWKNIGFKPISITNGLSILLIKMLCLGHTQLGITTTGELLLQLIYARRLNATWTQEHGIVTLVILVPQHAHKLELPHLQPN